MLKFLLVDDYFFQYYSSIHYTSGLMGTPYTGQYWPVLSIAWRLKQGRIKKEG